MISLPLKRTAMGAGAFGAAVAAGFFAGTVLGVPGTSGAAPGQDTVAEEPTSTTVSETELVADLSDLFGEELSLEQELDSDDLEGLESLAEVARLTNVLGFDVADLAAAALTSDTLGEAADSLGVGRDVAADTIAAAATASLETFVELGELDEATADAAIADIDTAVEAALDVEIDIMGDDTAEATGPGAEVLEELADTHDLSELEDVDPEAAETAARAGLDAAIETYAEGTGMDAASAEELDRILSELVTDGFAEAHWD
ncbi:MAG: hypothetical protein S0880_14900 [Actinomycetota bacterium]|nr:hypothetical protein [Actinomycetota bacterium]